jgi:ribonucleoside-diphosphate reductase alpha chain
MNEMCLDVEVNDPFASLIKTITKYTATPQLNNQEVHMSSAPVLSASQVKSACIQKNQTVFEDHFSKEVWASTYKDHEDTDVNDTMYRVAHAVASMEATLELQSEWTEKFYDLLSGFKATAGGRIYANAGTSWGGTTLMNCYVAPRGNYDIDSLTSILDTLRAQAQTLKSEGGWGENFSYIRPRGSFIHGIGVESPGSVKYMEMFDKSSEIITSGSGKKSTNKKAKGKIRKGAMMGVLDVWHPDIIEFITAKTQPGRLTKFNISVNCSDEFMSRINKIAELERERGLMGSSFSRSDEDDFEGIDAALAELDQWDLIFPDTMHPSYKADWNGDIQKWKSKGYPVVVHHTVSVKMLWNLIMESTYNRAEPGVLFLDRANYFGPLNYAETIFATNPCGEQTLAPGNVCNLASLNLVHFLKKDRTGFDLTKVKKYTQYMVRFLDNVSDLSKAPLPEYEWSMKNKRRIGVGILGWGSALYMLKTRFGSDEAAVIREELMKTIATTAYSYSVDLAEEKGMFSVCEPEKHAAGAFVQGLNLPADVLERMRTIGIRNSSLLSIQPTGNTSIFANVVSGGLEPVFMHEYIRTVIVNVMPDHIANITPKWYEGEWYETDMFKFAKEGDEEILRGTDPEGTVYKIDKNRGLTKEVLCEDYGVRFMKRAKEWDPAAPWAATTASMQVSDHVSDLTGFARWVDSAMSKTVNVPNDYPFADFTNIYLDAYKSGYVKGVTTYRSGTMVTVLAAKDEKNATAYDEEIILDDVKLPDSLPATVKTLRAEGRKWYLTCIWNDQQTRPYALFVHTNNHEKGVTTSDAIEQLVQLSRDKGIPERHIVATMEKFNNDTNATKIARMISLNLRHGVLIKNIVLALDRVQDINVGSFLYQIRKFLSSFIKDGEVVDNETCQECAGQVVYREGCKICISCGVSKC